MPLYTKISFVLIAVLLIAVAPILGWPIISSSTEMGLLFGVGLVVVAQPRWAWLVVILAGAIDETRSVLPIGLHLLSASIGLAVAAFAHKKLLSGHSQTQVVVLVAMSIVSAHLCIIAVRLIGLAAHADWLLPRIADVIQQSIPSLVWSSVVTFIGWPIIRRRWMPLQRISSWL